MAKKLKRILICSVKADKNIQEIALQAIETLSNMSVEVFVNENLANISKNLNYRIIKESNYKNIDLMIVIGGDAVSYTHLRAHET